MARPKIKKKCVCKGATIEHQIIKRLLRLLSLVFKEHLGAALACSSGNTKIQQFLMNLQMNQAKEPTLAGELVGVDLVLRVMLATNADNLFAASTRPTSFYD